MSIGIIGAGALGSNVARLLAKSGISATIANHRGPQSLANLVGSQLVVMPRHSRFTLAVHARIGRTILAGHM